MKTIPRRVTWASSEDLRCAIMGALGFSSKFIGEQTGLTPCQISYRLKIGNIRRSDYRNGNSHIAQRVIDKVAPTNQVQIRKTLNLKAPCAKK
jgi:hypothetical protein